MITLYRELENVLLPSLHLLAPREKLVGSDRRQVRHQAGRETMSLKLTLPTDPMENFILSTVFQPLIADSPRRSASDVLCNMRASAWSLQQHSVALSRGSWSCAAAPGHAVPELVCERRRQRHVPRFAQECFVGVCRVRCGPNLHLLAPREKNMSGPTGGKWVERR